MCAQNRVVHLHNIIFTLKLHIATYICKKKRQQDESYVGCSLCYTVLHILYTIVTRKIIRSLFIYMLRWYYITTNRVLYDDDVGILSMCLYDYYKLKWSCSSRSCEAVWGVVFQNCFHLMWMKNVKYVKSLLKMESILKI